MGGHQPVPPLTGSVSPLTAPHLPKPARNSGHLRPCKAWGCIGTSPAPALRMLLPVLAVSPLDNVSLQMPLVHSPPLPPALPSPGIEAGGCQGEQRVGLG